LIIQTRAINPNNHDDLVKIEVDLQAELLKLSPKSQQFFSKYEDHFIQKSEPELGDKGNSSGDRNNKKLLKSVQTSKPDQIRLYFTKIKTK
jgi:hypothetical protein